MNSNTNKIKKKRRKLKKSVKNIMFLTIIAINLVALIVGVYNLVLWKLDNNVENEEIIKIEKEVEVIEQEDTDETEIIEQTEPVPSTSLYWKYIQMNLINVDFTDLKNTNNDTVGWLQVGGTNINYPFVQASDNDYYLTHSFEKKKNQGINLLFRIKNAFKLVLKSSNFLIFFFSLSPEISNLPSIISKWTRSAPARSIFWISDPSLEKSADKILGAILTIAVLT